jgi:hypothetical protein
MGVGVDIGQVQPFSEKITPTPQSAEMPVTYCQLAKSAIVGRASEGDSANWQNVTVFLPIV